MNESSKNTFSNSFFKEKDSNIKASHSFWKVAIRLGRLVAVLGRGLTVPETSL